MLLLGFSVYHYKTSHLHLTVDYFNANIFLFIYFLSVIVQASDLDLDQVSYSIMSGDNRSNFVIDSRTGVVRLVKHRQPNLVGPLYVLNISASDGLHVSQAVLVVSIQDINNHKPVFKDCDKYRPVIAEDIAIGSPVIQVCSVFLY